MSFLAWLFGLGALAVAFPLIFHLIRRTPRGHQPFSSLIFLKQSPPRITRRSRLDNLLLLLLRGLAITLLAIAFMRPFFPQSLHTTCPARHRCPGCRAVHLRSARANHCRFQFTGNGFGGTETAGDSPTTELARTKLGGHRFGPRAGVCCRSPGCGKRSPFRRS